jgi:hypothetical protein
MLSESLARLENQTQKLDKEIGDIAQTDFKGFRPCWSF